LEKFEMKKSLIALAVLAASGAAMAQSSVTLYGIADIWLGSVKVETPASSVTNTMMQSGGVNGSRWGMKGSEDLGGGLKANFDLESGFNLDSGSSAQGGLLFGRQAWVGLSGGFGAVRFGRIASPYYDQEGALDAGFNSALSAQMVAFRTELGADSSLAASNVGGASRFNNAIRYDMPNMGGFSAGIEYGLTENKTPTVGAGGKLAFNVNYAAGPFAAVLAYDAQKVDGNATEVKNTRLGGSYDLGMAKLKVNYGKAGNVGAKSGADTTEYSLGADFPVSSVLTLSVNAAKSNDNATLIAGEQERTAFGISGAYTLSKRTFLYGGYVGGKQTASGVDNLKINVFAVGMQHRF
jgi:predicted porin